MDDATEIQVVPAPPYEPGDDHQPEEIQRPPVQVPVAWLAAAARYPYELVATRRADPRWRLSDDEALGIAEPAKRMIDEWLAAHPSAAVARVVATADHPATLLISRVAIATMKRRMMPPAEDGDRS